MPETSTPTIPSPGMGKQQCAKFVFVVSSPSSTTVSVCLSFSMRFGRSDAASMIISSTIFAQLVSPFPAWDNSVLKSETACIVASSLIKELSNHA